MQIYLQTKEREIMKIGIDIGGSHIGIGLVDNNGSILLKIEKFIKDKTNIKEQIEEFITETVIEMSLTQDVECIGILIIVLQKIFLSYEDRIKS